MNEEEIEKNLYDIFKKFIPEVDLKILWHKGKTLPLTGSAWNFDAIKMTYLFLEIEKTFSIHIHLRSLEKYRFNSVNGIIKTIGDALEKK